MSRSDECRGSCLWSTSIVPAGLHSRPARRIRSAQLGVSVTLWLII
jgi:hypothetical protein